MLNSSSKTLYLYILYHKYNTMLYIILYKEFHRFHKENKNYPFNKNFEFFKDDQSSGPDAFRRDSNEVKRMHHNVKEYFKNFHRKHKVLIIILLLIVKILIIVLVVFCVMRCLMRCHKRRKERRQRLARDRDEERSRNSSLSMVSDVNRPQQQNLMPPPPPPMNYCIPNGSPYYVGVPINPNQMNHEAHQGLYQPTHQFYSGNPMGMPMQQQQNHFMPPPPPMMNYVPQPMMNNGLRAHNYNEEYNEQRNIIQYPRI